MRLVMKMFAILAVTASVQSAKAGVYFSDNDALDSCVATVLNSWRGYIYDDGDVFFSNQLVICSNSYAKTQAEVDRIRTIRLKILSN